MTRYFNLLKNLKKNYYFLILHRCLLKIEKTIEKYFNNSADIFMLLLLAIRFKDNM